MTDLKKTITKGTLGTVAAGAMALASATPAMADDYRHKDKIDAGDVIAGAVIIGGIAALAGAFGGKKDRYHNDRYRDRNYRDRNYRDRNYRGYDNRGYDNRGYNNRGYHNGRNAVERCIHAAENQARRYGGYQYANVTQIRDVDRTRYGFRVKGRIQVEGSHGYNRRHFDRGSFTCKIQSRGRPYIDFDGVRGLR